MIITKNQKDKFSMSTHPSYISFYGKLFRTFYLPFLWIIFSFVQPKSHLDCVVFSAPVKYVFHSSNLCAYFGCAKFSGKVIFTSLVFNRNLKTFLATFVF